MNRLLNILFNSDDSMITPTKTQPLASKQTQEPFYNHFGYIPKEKYFIVKYTFKEERESDITHSSSLFLTLPYTPHRKERQHIVFRSITEDHPSLKKDSIAIQSFRELTEVTYSPKKQ